MKVRLATVDDIAFLARVSREVQLAHAEALPQVFKQPGPDAFDERFFRGLLGDPDAVILIAERDGEPVGFSRGSILREPETPIRHAWVRLHFKHIGVTGDERGRGAGHALVAAGVRYAREHGIHTITGDVWSFNTRMLKFLAKERHVTFYEHQWLDVDAYDLE